MLYPCVQVMSSKTHLGDLPAAGLLFASALLFVLSFFARSWQQVRVMILPSAAFSTAMLLATFLHWDRFSVGTFPFLI